MGITELDSQLNSLRDDQRTIATLREASNRISDYGMAQVESENPYAMDILLGVSQVLESINARITEIDLKVQRENK